jgi:hypothetical protein
LKRAVWGSGGPICCLQSRQAALTKFMAGLPPKVRATVAAAVKVQVSDLKLSLDEERSDAGAETDAPS